MRRAAVTAAAAAAVAWIATAHASAHYSEVVLRTKAIAVTVFLPYADGGEPAYYDGSRFDHGSMIGKVRG